MILADPAWEIFNREFQRRAMQEFEFLKAIARATQDARDLQAFEWLRERIK